MPDTPSPLSDEQYAAIRAREAAARPGPWRREDNKQDVTRWVTSEDGMLDISFGYLGNNSQDDADFVAHAREDVPALLAELDRLRAAAAVALQLLDDGPQMVNDRVEQHWSVPALRAAEVMRAALNDTARES